MVFALAAFDAHAAGDRILTQLRLSGSEFRYVVPFGDAAKQHRVVYRGREVIVQEDGAYFSFRNLASTEARRALFEARANPTTPSDGKEKIHRAGAAIAENLAKGASKWTSSVRGLGGGRRPPRAFSEGWRTASISYTQGAYGYKTNGCGNSIHLSFDLTTFAVASATMQRGWTYRKPKIKISKDKAIAAARVPAKAKGAPKSTELKYVLPTWAFGVDHRRKARECVLAYECIWDSVVAMIDAETGEVIGGARFGIR